MLEEFVMETNAQKEKIWSLWADVTNWNKWYAGIEYAYLNGNFENGINGSFKTFDGVESAYHCFELRDCIPQKSFTGRIHLPLCILDLRHILIEEDTTLKIKHYIKMYGVLEFRYKSIGANMAKKLPGTVKALVQLAEK